MKKLHPVEDGRKAYQGRSCEPVPPLKDILTEPVVLSVVNNSWFAFIDMAYAALQPLFYATPTRLGGLGMSPPTIGMLLGGFGLLNGIAQGVFFAKVVRRLGLKRVFLISLFCHVPLFVMFPIISHLVREQGLSPVVWTLVVSQLVISCATNMANGKCSLLNASTPLTLSPSRPHRLRVPIYDLLCRESASARQREWHRTNCFLDRPGVGPGDSNTALRIHTTDQLARWTRDLCRLRHCILVRCTPRRQASRKVMETQVTKHSCLTSHTTFFGRMFIALSFFVPFCALRSTGVRAVWWRGIGKEVVINVVVEIVSHLFSLFLVLASVVWWL